MFARSSWPTLLALLAASCVRSDQKPTTPTGGASEPAEDGVGWLDPTAYLPAPPAREPRRARPAPAPVVIRHATILTAAGRRIEDGTIVLVDGRIAAIGDASLEAPAGAQEIDATGRFVTPGLIDTHSHIGVYPATGSTSGDEDGNEASALNTADAAAEYAYLAQDPAILRAQAGGVTIAQILPGSANLIGGRGLVVQMRTGRGADEVRLPDARPTIKMACGENPKRTHGKKGGPVTRMGLVADLRAIFRGAAEYQAHWAIYRVQREAWEKKRERPGAKPEPAPSPPGFDARREVLAAVLRGEVLVQFHCYTSRDMLAVLDVARDFGFQVRSFHHALEAYKIRDVLAARGVGVSTWADWWGFKIEAFDGIPENAALLAQAGVRVAIHSDSAIGIQRLNQEAAKAMYAGRAAGIDVSEDQALRWITADPAWVLGIDEVTGTLEPGKRADVVVWNGHPFSVYARADLVYVAGELVYDRRRGLEPTDFELGNSGLPDPPPPAVEGGVR